MVIIKKKASQKGNKLSADPCWLYLSINFLQLQVNFPINHQKRKSTLYYSRSALSIHQLFMTAGWLSQQLNFLSGIIEEKASQKKQIDFLLFQVNLTYQSTFCNSKSNFCCSIKFICESTFYNYKSIFPEVTRKEINFLLLQINFCSNSKPSTKGSWLYLQSTFCNSKSTLPQLTEIEINSLLLQVNSSSTSEWNYKGRSLSKLEVDFFSKSTSEWNYKGGSLLKKE